MAPFLDSGLDVQRLFGPKDVPLSYCTEIEFGQFVTALTRNVKGSGLIEAFYMCQRSDSTLSCGRLIFLQLFVGV